MIRGNRIVGVEKTLHLVPHPQPLGAIHAGTAFGWSNPGLPVAEYLLQCIQLGELLRETRRLGGFWGV